MISRASLPLSQEESVDWTEGKGGNVEHMDVSSHAHAPTDRSPVVGSADLDMEMCASMEVERDKEDVLSLCSRLFQDRAEQMSPQVHTATYTVMQALRGGSFAPGS